MKNLKTIILEKILINKDTVIRNRTPKDTWDIDDFDDTEVNYYLFNYIDNYNSAAGPQTQEYRHYCIIWDDNKLSLNEINDFIDKKTSFNDKPTNKMSISNNALKVRHDTLKNIYNEIHSYSRKCKWHCWTDVYDKSIDKKVYWVDY